MIKYNLKCENNHEFESWFSSSEEFDNLNKKKLLECIYCTSKSIEKSIMAPMVSLVNSDKKKFNSLENILKDEKNKLLELRNYVEKNFEFVGDNFSKKVREVYYDKKNKRTFYGTTTPEERKELENEGIDLSLIHI